MKKKILIISYSYPPSNAPAAQRPYALAKYLDKSKYEVTVITCGNADSSLGFDLSVNEELPDVNLIKINSKFSSKNVDAQRKMKMTKARPSLKSRIKKLLIPIASQFIVKDKAMLWYPNVISYVKKNSELVSSSDIVFTTSPLFTNHFIGEYIKKQNKEIKWVADFRDFHFIERTDKIKMLAKRSFRQGEQMVIEGADQVVFISSAMKDVYAKHYGNYVDKFNVVYNGFDFDDFASLKFEPVQDSKMVVFYAGSFHKGERSPFPFFSLLDRAIAENVFDPQKLVIKIAGNFDEDMIDELKTYQSYECVEFLGLIPRSEVLKSLTTSTMLWLIVGNRLTHYTGVPIKFYEYLASRRPIMNFAPSNSEPSKIITEHGLGWNFNTDFDDTDAHLKAFKDIIENVKANTLSNPLPDASIQLYTRRFQAGIMEQIIEK